jgi:hypothetical protein
MLKARTCYGCKKQTGGIWAIDGAYWHFRCFVKAKPEKREAARAARRHLTNPSSCRMTMGEP